MIQKTFEAINSVIHFDVKRIGFYRVVAIAMLFELFFSAFVINMTSYTEIDWIAYMQEVGGYLSGELDYAKLRGDTGPLVYPAGFVYIYSLLFKICDNGTNIRRAQYIFALLHSLFIGVFVAILYMVVDTSSSTKHPKKSKKKQKTTDIFWRKFFGKDGKEQYENLPLWVVGATMISRRIHSIFVLRLFNDCWAVFFAYIAIALMVYICTSRRNIQRAYSNVWWALISIIYSFAVSIKMNILLYAPAIGLLYFRFLGFSGTVFQVFICILTQCIVGAPFLLNYPYSYVTRAFNLGKDFEYKWTVNFKWVDEKLFLNKSFGYTLLAAQLLALLFCAQLIWCSRDGGILGYVRKYWTVKRVHRRLKGYYITDRLFFCNFLGIVFAKSLHYQFYVWYFHTLPYLVWRSRLTNILKWAIVVSIEVVWNIYPSKPISSVSLCVMHMIVMTEVLVFQLYTYFKRHRKADDKTE